MNELIEKMKEKKGFVCFGKVDDDKVTNAEKTLHLQFADDFKSYVSLFGAASFDGHELTGICSSKRLNVIDVTLCEKTNCIPADLYVVERTNIDGIVIWQSKDGAVYENQNGGSVKQIATSLFDYLSL